MWLQVCELLVYLGAHYIFYFGLRSFIGGCSTKKRSWNKRRKAERGKDYIYEWFQIETAVWPHRTLIEADYFGDKGGFSACKFFYFVLDEYFNVMFDMYL